MLQTWCPYVFFSMISFACKILLGKEGKGGEKRREGGEGENQTGLVSDASSHVLRLNLFFTNVLWVQEFGWGWE